MNILKKMSRLSLLLPLLFFTPAKAVDSSLKKCPHFRNGTSGVHFYRQFVEPNSCFLDFNLSLVPHDSVYRTYMTSQEGLFMVFNSYSDGDSPMALGMRNFYFFPRDRTPNAIVETAMVNNQNIPVIRVKTGSSLATFTINGLTGELISLEGGSLQIDPNIQRNNGGGVEILKHQGLMLDSGFGLGHDPNSAPSKDVYFEDSEGERCTVKNSEIFTYGSHRKVNLTHKTDKELSAFLRIRCPQLKLAF